ncbi:MAG: GNAT family N-acetyltransferase [Collimonas sp.]|uniref:GNAT family N-acetyltransferase n=1 Tax=Collimonas sp. TaxID=1963772 RepID=UPI00326755D6
MTIHQLNTLRKTKPSDVTPDLTIKIVESEDERLKAMLVRAIVYMHEQQCPYHEEFDLNDHTSTQIIGMTPDDEPVLTARIRYFNGFAKIERLAIRSEYRGNGYGHRLLSFILHLCRQKGFSRFYLHAQARLQPFYSGYGFRAEGGDFAFSDHEYVEMVLNDRELPAQPSLHIGGRPMALNRPENNLHQSGPLEHRTAVMAAPTSL